MPIASAIDKETLVSFDGRANWDRSPWETAQVTDTPVSVEQFGESVGQQREGTINTGRNIDVTLNGPLRIGSAAQTSHYESLESWLQGKFYAGVEITSAANGRAARGASAAPSGGTVAATQADGTNRTIAVTGSPTGTYTNFLWVTIDGELYLTLPGSTLSSLILDRPLHSYSGTARAITWSLPDVLVNRKDTTDFDIQRYIPVDGTDYFTQFQDIEVVGGSITWQSQALIQLAQTGIGRRAVTPSTAGVLRSTPRALGRSLSSGRPTRTMRIIGRSGQTNLTATFESTISANTATFNWAYEGRDRQPQITSDDLAGIARGAYRPTINLNAYVGSQYRTYEAAARADEHCSVLLGPAVVDTNNAIAFYYHDCQFGVVSIPPNATGSEFQDITLNPNAHAMNDPYGQLLGTVAVIRKRG